MKPMKKTYPLSETFLSIQGEGVHAGRLALFLRFGECNLECGFCDTKQKIGRYRSCSLEQLKKILAQHKARTSYLVLTGGEPGLQDLTGLLEAARRFRYTTALETNGTLYRDWMSQVNWVSVSPKPGSLINPRVLALASELKFVITRISDINYAESFMPFSPAFLMPSRNSRRLSLLILSYLKKSRFKDCFKLGTQLHRVYGFK
jgi:7-carboxy-7-deazaguanine synthase